MTIETCQIISTLLVSRGKLSRWPSVRLEAVDRGIAPRFFVFFPPIRHVGLVVKASASRAEDPGFDSRLHHGDFSGSSDTSDLKTGAPVATLTSACCYRVSTGNGWTDVNIL